MASIFAFTCSCCGKIHEGSPSFAYPAPWHYHSLSDEQKALMGDLTSDLCTIDHDNGNTDHFIRAVLKVPIHGFVEPFTWGAWVSLSETSFDRYVETYNAPVEGDGFFGWFANELPFYPDTIDLPANVHVQTGGKRPLIELQHKGGPVHPLVVDQLEGISAARAQLIAKKIAHRE